jgi:hypothetical protein
MSTVVQREPSPTYLEEWDKTDRPFHFPSRESTVDEVMEGATPHALNSKARSRWLEAHDVRTQFLDAGIGCCWFAQLGDQEPVSGATEEEAITRLAQENGLELWDDSTTTGDA